MVTLISDSSPVSKRKACSTSSGIVISSSQKTPALIICLRVETVADWLTALLIVEFTLSTYSQLLPFPLVDGQLPSYVSKCP